MYATPYKKTNQWLILNFGPTRKFTVYWENLYDAPIKGTQKTPSQFSSFLTSLPLVCTMLSRLDDNLHPMEKLITFLLAMSS